VTPASLSVGPGQSATYDVTFTYESRPLEFYLFGSLTWVSNDHTVRSVLYVRPLSVSAPGDIIAFGSSGNVTFPVEFGYTGAYSPETHGLNLPLVLDGFVAQDPDKTFTRGISTGVAGHLIEVPADQLFVRFALFDALTDGDDDLDLYVYYCPDDDNCWKIGESGGPTSEEQVDVLLPGAGSYEVYVHRFETDNVAGGPDANYTLLAWSFGIVDDPGNMTTTGPGFVNVGTTGEVTVEWSGLSPDTIYLGGISHNTPDGRVSLTVISVQN